MMVPLTSCDPTQGRERLRRPLATAPRGSPRPRSHERGARNARIESVRTTEELRVDELRGRPPQLSDSGPGR